MGGRAWDNNQERGSLARVGETGWKMEGELAVKGENGTNQTERAGMDECDWKERKYEDV